MQLANIDSNRLVIGSADGRVIEAIEYIADLHKQHGFKFAICLGNLFSHKRTTSADVVKLKNEKVKGMILNGRFYRTRNSFL